MNKHRNGFSLAEIIIALSIIGIVAVIMVPSIAKVKNQDGVILGRAIEQIELGCQNIIMEYNLQHAGASIAQTLYGADIDTIEELRDSLESYTKSESMGFKDGYPVYSFSNVPGEYSISSFSGGAGASPDAKISAITIDINGFDTTPNINGTDQFSFDITNGCKLIPNDDAAEAVIEAGFKIEE